MTPSQEPSDMTPETLILSLPITRVTCLEDRAQVERQGEVSLAPGFQRVRIAPVSPLAVDRSLKVELSGATLADAKVVRTYKPVPKGGLREDASALQKASRAVQKELEAHRQDTQRLETRLALIRQARTDLTKSITEEAGHGLADRERWGRQLAHLSEEGEGTEDALRQVRLAQQTAQEKLSEINAALARVGEWTQELVTAIELSLEAPPEAKSPLLARLKVGYLVPCALWRPAYRATLTSPKGGEQVGIEADAMVWQRTFEDWKDVALVFSTARPTLCANPPTLSPDWLNLRDKSEAEKQTVDVAVREEQIQTVGEGGRTQAREMPGLDDGGEVRVLSSPHQATVPSDGQPHRVPLFSFTAPVTSERLCTPEKSSLSSLLAKFENPGPHPLLAGPVDLVRGGGFVGRGEVKFSAVGEKVKLSFGSEDAVRVVRVVSDEVEVSRLTGRRVTQRTVRLFVSNAGGEPVKLAVEERLPVSEIAQVEVKPRMDKANPTPQGPSADGILRYELDLSGRERRELRFVYEINASSKVSGL